MKTLDNVIRDIGNEKTRKRKKEREKQILRKSYQK